MLQPNESQNAPLDLEHEAATDADQKKQWGSEDLHQGTRKEGRSHVPLCLLDPTPDVREYNAGMKRKRLRLDWGSSSAIAVVAGSGSTECPVSSLSDGLARDCGHE
eukprot:1329109-Amphidinium_carterae.1